MTHTTHEGATTLLQQVLKDLARAKAVFQQRAIVAAMEIPKQSIDGDHDE